MAQVYWQSQDGSACIYNGDCAEVMRGMEAESVDSIVTDPPYGLSFMGKKWDYDVPSVDIWRECLRVLKPGGHLLSFGGTRTYHRLVVAIEDAGFEVRDTIAWLYGSGFPKSLDVSKAIDAAAGAEREVVGQRIYADGTRGSWRNAASDKYAQDEYTRNATHAKVDTAPATPAAEQWQGWGTALKPAHEPIVLCRKPLIGTVAANVQRYGTGAMNIDGCRVSGSWERSTTTKHDIRGGRMHSGTAHLKYECEPQFSSPLGRWPANVIHDGSEEVLAGMPVTKSGNVKPYTRTTTVDVYSHGNGKAGRRVTGFHTGDSGSAARFFYCAKASRRDRGDGNTHATIKPTDLMRYLCRLVTPPGGIVLDPFNGSGSTGKAAVKESFRYIGIEREREYCEISKGRIEAAIAERSERLIA